VANSGLMSDINFGDLIGDPSENEIDLSGKPNAIANADATLADSKGNKKACRQMGTVRMHERFESWNNPKLSVNKNEDLSKNSDNKK
jgi:hypothetical protein